MCDGQANKTGVASALARDEISDVDGRPTPEPAENRPRETIALSERLQPQGGHVIERKLPSPHSKLLESSKTSKKLKKSTVQIPRSVQGVPREALQYEPIFQVCTDDVPTLQPQRCLRCVRLYELAFPCRFLA